ncbi:MAG: hypothetical protein FJY65_08350 [Calditrichaeota bacterium]|nr:hypothetical protein [Calditrichota bacterium]
MALLEKLSHIDRRIIFVLIALAVIIPMLFNLVFIVRPSPIVEAIFEKIESLPAGSKILLSYDYGPSTVPENQPMADALTRHCLVKGLKVYIMAVWATGEAQANVTIDSVIRREFPDKVYGVDWIHLGYKAGNQGLINAIFTDLKGMYTTDAAGVDINTFPMMASIQGLRDFDLILSSASGKPGLKEWVQFAGDRGNIPVAGGVTAVEAPLLYPYYPRQLLGLMGGLQGAAEYEAVVVHKYPQFKATSLTAVKSMGPQTVAHLVIIFFVVVGNVAFFLQRRKEKRARTA